jgi:hypothetical protein
MKTFGLASLASIGAYFIGLFNVMLADRRLFLYHSRQVGRGRHDRGLERKERRLDLERS